MDPDEAAAAIRYLTTGTYVPGMSGGEKRKMRRMKTMFIYHEREDGSRRLYFRRKDSATSKPEQCQMVLLNDGVDPSPFSIIEKAHHDSKIDAHFSIEETYRRVSREWWWPRYLDEIRDYVRHCDQCTSRNGPTPEPAKTTALSTSSASGRSQTKKSYSTAGPPTMVLPSRAAVFGQNDSPALADDHRGVNEDEDEDQGISDAMSSSSLIENLRPAVGEGGGGSASFVEKDEHGGVTIVIPSEPVSTSIRDDSCRSDVGASTLDEVSVPKSTLCGECGCVIRNAGNVAVHMRRHLQYRPYHCNLCDYQGYDMDDVKRHAVRQHLGNSTESGVLYKPQLELETQLKEMIAGCKTTGGRGEENETDADPTLVLDDDKRQQQPTPNFALFSTNFSDAAPNGKDFPSSEENSVLLSCNLCNQAVPHSPVPLLRHLKSHFAFDGYSCPHCVSNGSNGGNDGAPTVAYRTLRDFETHLQSSLHKTHPTVSKLQTTLDRAKRLVCDQMNHFVEHAFTDARIKCQLCSRMIAWRRQTISDHLREHNGYYPYNCSICHVPFIDLPALIEHIHTERHMELQDHDESTQENGNDPTPTTVIHYCPDVKAENEAFAVFPKCFPLLTSEFIDSLDEDSPSIGMFSVQFSKSNNSGNSTFAMPSRFNVQSQTPPGDALDRQTPPSDSILVSNGANRSTLRCQLCQAQISRNMSCLIAHAKVHLAYKPLKCDHCNFRHFAMSKIRRHNARVHGSKPVKVSYHPVPDIGRQIKEMKWQCFGSYGGGLSNAPAATLVTANQIEDPALLEDEELRVLHEQEMVKTNDRTEAKSFQISDLLKEMVTMSNPSNGARMQLNQPTAMDSHSSAVSSLSSLLAERMAAFENLMHSPQSDRGIQQRADSGSNSDQPVGNGLGKKVCSLCSAMIANNPSSFENHACKHLDYKPYSCHYCPYQSYIRGKVTRHIQQVHSGEQVKISHRPVPGIRDRIQAVKLTCFPFLASLMNGEELSMASKAVAKLQRSESRKQEPSTVDCLSCKSVIPNEPAATEAHLIESHMPQKIYCCVSCSHRSPQLWKAKQHAAGAHAPDVSRYLTCPADEDEGTEPLMALQILRLKCYGAMQLQHTRLVEPEVESNSLFGSNANLDQSPLPVENSKDDDDDCEEMTEDGHGALEKGLTLLRCKTCSEVVPNRLDSVKDHIKRNHSTPTGFCFQCSYCSWTSMQSELDVKQHILVEHKNEPLKVARISLADKGKDFKESMEYWKLFFPTFRSAGEDRADGDQSNYLASLIANFAGGDGKRQSTAPSQIGNAVQAPPVSQSSNGGGGLRKLICKLCNSTIADNPKSVGIHVKNHLNYKPYRCPFCRYMSCEQSKARRHIEHVHNANGDAIEVHAQENIKDRIAEMKARCFPNLGHMALSDVYSNGDDAATTGSCSPEYPPAANANGNAAVPTSSSSAAQISHSWNGSGFPSTASQSSSIFPTLKPSPNAVPIFPQLHPAATDNLFLSQRFLGFQCRLCKTANVRVEEMNAHVQTHLATGLDQGLGKWNQTKPYQCSYCGVRFGNDDKVSAHMANVHPSLPPKFVYQPEHLADQEQLLSMKKRCFPELFVNYLNDFLLQSGNPGGADVMAAVAAMSSLLASKSNGSMLDEDQPLSKLIRKELCSPSFGLSAMSKNVQDASRGSFDVNLISPNHSTLPLPQTSKISTPIDGRLTCQICDQAVSMNPNSLDVHVKNHLDFKPHSCAYCDYKSCIAGKVKRHLDNVHKGKQPKVDSFTRSSNALKQIIADMRTACFPSMEGDYRSKTAFELSMTVEKLRKELKSELAVLQSLEKTNIRQSTSENSLYHLEVRTDEASANNSMIGVFSPPMARTKTTDILSPQDDGNVPSESGGVDTSLDEDMISNCGTDTLSESGLGSGNSGAAMTVSGNSGTGKVSCMLCGAMVADNPSSLGLHVRNHLDYKPFHCQLCDYKSCIQAKVKRHLRNVHKCPTDEMTYNPIANIRAKVTEMKIQCFPREADASSIGRTSSLALRDYSERSSFEPNGGTAYNSWAMETGSMLDAEDDGEETGDGDDANGALALRLGSQRAWASNQRGVDESTRNDLEQLAAVFTGLADDESGGSSIISFIGCQICGERVASDDLSKTKHLTKHVGDYEFRCQYCNYASFVQAETMKHITVQHPKQPVRVGRSTANGEKRTTAYERLSQQCFPVGDSAVTTTSRGKNKAVVCALCDVSVANEADIRLAHAADHNNNPCYRCPECPFIHSDDSRVTDHLQQDHGQSNLVAVKVDQTDADELYAMCFPEKGSVLSTFLNGGSPVESDSADAEDDVEADEDEDLELEEGSQAYSGPFFEGAKIMADGPRYICKLCQTPVSMYASSLYVHVKNHMNYKPYTCTGCDYKSPVKSKVRRHIQNAHKSQSGSEATVCYLPKPGVEQEILKWKKRCFPEVSAVATMNNDKIQCRICHADVSETLLSKSIHAKNHLDAKPYYCPYCAYKSCLRGETRRHVVRQHQDRPVDIRYEPGDVAKQVDIDAMIERCFVCGPPTNGNGKIEQSDATPNADADPAISGSAKRKLQSPIAGPPAKKEKKASDGEIKMETEVTPQRSSVYNLRATRSSTLATSVIKTKKEPSSDDGVKLGPAYRDWYCCYCSFKAHSKYVVKQHCLNEHPGQPVDVSEMSRVTSS